MGGYMNFGNAQRLRLAPLALALSAQFAHAGASFDANVAMPATWTPGDRSGVAAIFQTLRARSRPTLPHAPAVNAVTSCLDDGGADTLRAVIAAAGEGDTIDLSALTCSAITLAQGAIPVMLNDLTIVGPGPAQLAIDGAHSDRVFLHYGYYGTLRLQQLGVRNGTSIVSGYRVTGGACILSGGSVALDHAVVRDCVASGEGVYGGAILARSVTMYTSTLSGNLALGAHPKTFTAAYGGGAMAYLGAITLYDSSVTGNRSAHDLTDTHGSYCTGGGVFSDFGGYALRSTISGNYSYGTGGGFAAHGGVFLTDSTISGNTAKFKAGGGLFVHPKGASLQFNNNTIAFNSAAAGGGIYVSGSSRAVLMQSTIVANNTAADFAASDTLAISGTNNLVPTTGAGVSSPADTVLADPQLLPLADNGGPTLTHALAPQSPARDAGANPASLATDQRGAGHPRVVGAAADIGAVEMRLAVSMPATVPMLPAWAVALLMSLLAWTGMRGRRRGRVGVASST